MCLRAKNIVVYLIITLSSPIFSQANVDSIFNKAIENTRINQFDKAISEANTALQADPTRGDIFVFSANVYSWKNKNDSALIQLDKARKLNYLNDDFYDAALAIMLRVEKNDSLLALCNEAEKMNYKDSANLLSKRMLAYQNKNQFKKIITLYNETNSLVLRKNPIIESIYRNAKQESLIQTIAIDYTIDMFQEIPSQHFASINYTNVIKNVTTSIGINYANRFNKSNIQFDYTGYFSGVTKNYWYINYGYAYGKDLFPKHRLGLEYFFGLFPKWDASFGGRYLNYPLVVDKYVYILTGNIGAYIKNSWISFRPYFVIKDTDRSISFTTKYRLYNTINPQNFWGIEFGFGNSPDDMYTSSLGSFSELMSYKFKIERNTMLTDNSILFVAAGYVSEEIAGTNEKRKRNRYVIDIGYRFKF
jgi:YaiO family outer membrane protein